MNINSINKKNDVLANNRGVSTYDPFLSGFYHLINQEKLTKTEFLALLSKNSPELRSTLSKKALEQRHAHYQHQIYIRGLIEISNYCINNCYYCGIRCDNHKIKRYRMKLDDILSCCKEGYALGFRTFVLQGGEDIYYSDDILTTIIQAIHTTYPDCAITLSLGERTKESYQALFQAGATRYLLRHETANPAHYNQLHPSSMSFSNRINCLHILKEIGYQVGCGFMVGSPYQTLENLAQDLLFIQDFQPHMVGIGPFLSHSDTPFFDQKNGSLADSLLILSILRLMQPKLLLPATTALATLDPQGRELGILAGANVIMPNLSPQKHRAKYSLYDHKVNSGEESAQSIKILCDSMKKLGYEIVIDKGDSLV